MFTLGSFRHYFILHRKSFNPSHTVYYVFRNFMDTPVRTAFTENPIAKLKEPWKHDLADDLLGRIGAEYQSRAHVLTGSFATYTVKSNHVITRPKRNIQCNSDPSCQQCHGIFGCESLHWIFNLDNTPT